MLELPLVLTTVLAVVALPMTGLAALWLVIERIERARGVRVARQIALTDAIHRELGPVVAPVVKQRVGRGWRVAIAVPFESPTIVGRVAAIAHAVMLGGGPSRVEIVLTALEPRTRAISMREHAGTRTSLLTAGEPEVIAWTGTTTLRAS